MLKYDVLIKTNEEPKVIGTFDNAFSAVNYAQECGAGWVAEHGDNGYNIVFNYKFTRLAYKEYAKIVNQFPWFNH